MPATTIKTVLAATTDAANSSAFSVTNEQPQTVIVEGLAGVEVGALEVCTTEEGNTFVAATDTGGAIECTASNNTIMVVGPGTYRIAKDATASAVAVVIAG